MGQLTMITDVYAVRQTVAAAAQCALIPAHTEFHKI